MHIFIILLYVVGKNFNWTEKQQTAFDILKAKFCEQPLLQRSYFFKPFIHTTDASGFAIGDILSQGI